MRSQHTRFAVALFLAFSSFSLFFLFGHNYHDSWLPSYARQGNLADMWNNLPPDSSTEANNTREQASNIGSAIQHEAVSLKPPLLVDNLADVFNATLGAQEVFMLSLPTRRDKHDAFAVQALASNITYTVADGVDGDSVPKKALPHKMNLKPVEIGCWRAHMNVFEEILDRKIATAVIFEDDADWDVSFRQQLHQFAKGSRYVTSTEAKGDFIPHSPYGEDWDILWLGHCNSRTTQGDNKRFVIEHDPTVVPQHVRQGWEKPITRHWDRNPASDSKTRVIFRTSDSSCTAAYIISLHAAQKAVYYLSMNPSDQPIDNGLGHLCGDPSKDFKCITSFPTLVGISKPAGSSNRGSDVGHAPTEESVSDEAHSERLVYSTRMNLQKPLLPTKDHDDDLIKSAFPESSPDMLLADIVVPEGYKFEFDEIELAAMKAEEDAERDRRKEEELRKQKSELETEKQALAAKESHLVAEELQAEQDRLKKEEQEIRDGLGELQNLEGAHDNASEPQAGLQGRRYEHEPRAPQSEAEFT